jgi:competence protein ComEC
VGFSFAAALFAAGYLLPGDTLPLFGFVLLAAGAAFLALTFFLTCKNVLRAALLIALGLSAGLFWRWGYDQLFLRPALIWDGQTVAVAAEALDFPSETPYGARVTARLTFPDGGRFRAVLYLDEFTDLRPGDRLTLTVKCTAPSPDDPNDPLAYDRPRGAILRATQAAGPVVLTRPDAPTFVHWPRYIARALGDGLNNALPPAQAALTRGFLLGQDDDLSEGFRAALNDTGTAHTVAVSGLHVSFLVGLILLVTGNRRRAIWLGVPVIFLFVAVAGFPPSAMRAGIMQLSLLLAYALGREGDGLTALAFALVLLTAVNPYAVADVGLQLSFASALGILLFARRFYDALSAHKLWPEKFLPKGRRYILSTLATSLAVLIFAEPLIALHYDTLSLVSPFANLLTLWSVAVSFAGSAVVALLSLIWTPLAVGAGFVVMPFTWFYETVIRALAQLPFAALKLTSPYFAWWGLLVYLLFWLHLFWPKREGERRRPFGTLGVAAAALALAMTLSFVQPEPLRIIALNIGQGQCILVLTPTQTAVIDCGGNLSDVAGIAADTLRGLGRRRIDLLALTHAHEDHAGGVEALLELMEVGSIALPAIDSAGVSLRQEVLFLARRQGIPVAEISQTTDWPLGAAAVTLYPPLSLTAENEMSLAMLVHMGQFEFLVTGDMSAAMERALVRRETLPDIEVLMVGHHGSKYASSDGLLTAVAPEAAVISVGRNNYGHPTEETLTRLRDHGIEIYRTDQSGNITILIG